MMAKKRIAWITDSTAYITKELRDHPDLYVIPLSITFKDATFEDGVNLTTEEMYKRIRSEKEIPKSSQPSIGTYLELFGKLEEEYDGAIAIHVSSEISGTYNSCLAATELTSFPVEVVDSKSMSYAITTLIHKGFGFIAEETEIGNIAEKLRKETSKSMNFVLLGSLEQFYKGGRMSGTQYLLGNFLRIKPIISINSTGKFEVFEKVRTERKAIKRIIQLLDDAYQRYLVHEVQIMHGNVLEKAIQLEQELEKRYPKLKIIIGEISATIAVHAGEGTLATIWHNEPKSVE